MKSNYMDAPACHGGCYACSSSLPVHQLEAYMITLMRSHGPAE